MHIIVKVEIILHHLFSISNKTFLMNSSILKSLILKNYIRITSAHNNSIDIADIIKTPDVAV